MEREEHGQHDMKHANDIMQAWMNDTCSGAPTTWKVSKNVHDPLLSWWLRYGPSKPEIFQVALEMMAVPATSVPCERVFSTSKRVSAGDRSNIHPHRLQAAVRIHENNRRRASPRCVGFQPPALVAQPAVGSSSDSDLI